MLKIWGRRNSSNVQKVMWLIAELGLEHERIDAGGSYGLLDSPDFLRMNPHGRIPVLEDAGTTVWESHAILRYVAAAYGGEDVWPPDPRERAAADQWIDWTQATLQRDFMNLFWGFYRTPESHRDAAFIEDALQRSVRGFQLLDEQLAGRDYLLGARMTLADIPAGSALYRFFELDIDRPDLPNVMAWYERLRSRPAYRDHVMVPFDELFGRLSY